MGERTDILYDNNERVSYLSTERVKNMLIEIDGFYVFKSAFRSEKEGHVDALLGCIEKIRYLIPNEIRGILPDHFGLSNKALGKLEEECKETLKEIKRESAFT